MCSVAVGCARTSFASLESPPHRKIQPSSRAPSTGTRHSHTQTIFILPRAWVSHEMSSEEVQGQARSSSESETSSEVPRQARSSRRSLDPRGCTTPRSACRKPLQELTNPRADLLLNTTPLIECKNRLKVLISHQVDQQWKASIRMISWMVEQ